MRLETTDILVWCGRFSSFVEIAEKRQNKRRKTLWNRRPSDETLVDDRERALSRALPREIFLDYFHANTL